MSTRRQSLRVRKTVPKVVQAIKDESSFIDNESEVEEENEFVDEIEFDSSLFGGFDSTSAVGVTDPDPLEITTDHDHPEVKLNSGPSSTNKTKNRKQRKYIHDRESGDGERLKIQQSPKSSSLQSSCKTQTKGHATSLTLVNTTASQETKRIYDRLRGERLQNQVGSNVSKEHVTDVTVAVQTPEEKKAARRARDALNKRRKREALKLQNPEGLAAINERNKLRQRQRREEAKLKKQDAETGILMNVAPDSGNNQEEVILTPEEAERVQMKAKRLAVVRKRRMQLKAQELSDDQKKQKAFKSFQYKLCTWKARMLKYLQEKGTSEEHIAIRMEALVQELTTYHWIQAENKIKNTKESKDGHDNDNLNTLDITND